MCLHAWLPLLSPLGVLVETPGQRPGFCQRQACPCCWPKQESMSQSLTRRSAQMHAFVIVCPQFGHELAARRWDRCLHAVIICDWMRPCRPVLCSLWGGSRTCDMSSASTVASSLWHAVACCAARGVGQAVPRLKSGHQRAQHRIGNVCHHPKHFKTLKCACCAACGGGQGLTRLHLDISKHSIVENCVPSSRTQT